MPPRDPLPPAIPSSSAVGTAHGRLIERPAPSGGRGRQQPVLHRAPTPADGRGRPEAIRELAEPRGPPVTRRVRRAPRRPAGAARRAARRHPVVERPAHQLVRRTGRQPRPGTSSIVPPRDARVERCARARRVGRPALRGCTSRLELRSGDRGQLQQPPCVPASSRASRWLTTSRTPSRTPELYQCTRQTRPAVEEREGLALEAACATARSSGTHCRPVSSLRIPASAASPGGRSPPRAPDELLDLVGRRDPRAATARRRSFGAGRRAPRRAPPARRPPCRGTSRRPARGPRQRPRPRWRSSSSVGGRPSDHPRLPRPARRAPSRCRSEEVADRAMAVGAVRCRDRPQRQR